MTRRPDLLSRRRDDPDLLARCLADRALIVETEQRLLNTLAWQVDALSRQAFPIDGGIEPGELPSPMPWASRIDPWKDQAVIRLIDVRGLLTQAR